jgi:hypothetical protein
MAIAHAITRSVRDSAALLDATAGAIRARVGDTYDFNYVLGGGGAV